MSVIKNALGEIVLTCVIVISICLGLAQSAEESLANGRVERAVLGRRKNFPVLNSIPETTFSCQGRSPGFYADEEHGCQVFHRCHTDRRKDSFLCPNETIFHQQRLVCDWWYNVDCSSSAQHISVNDEIGRIPPRNNEPSTPNHRQPSFTSISNFGQNPKTQSSLSTDSPASRIDSSRGAFGLPLQGLTNEGNIDNRNIGIHRPPQRTRTQSSSSIQSSLRSNNRISNPVSSRTGVALPALSRNNFLSNTATSKTTEKQRNNIHSTFGVPLSAARDNRISLPVTTLSPRFPNQVTIPKPQRTGVPLSSTNRDRTTHRNDNRQGNLPGRRVAVNKRPISSLSTHTGRDGGLKSGVSLPHFRTPQTFGGASVGNRIPTKTTAKPRKQDATPFVNINKQGVAILNDRKTTSQFFNIGTPRVVTNKRPITTRPNIRTGRPLPASNLKSNRGNRERINNQGSQSPSPFSGFQSGRTNTQRKNIGRPLPATNLQSRQGTNPSNLRHPSSAFNQHSSRNGAFRKVAKLPGSSRNFNRGTATFQTSLNNRGVINRLLKNRNRGSLRNNIQGQNIVIDIDDLDDILDDRFDTHERIDDPFDDDRFDLDDRFDDIDDHLDDRFDFDDRFDDDRFDLDDRFDDDRFDLDDRFDDDRFDLDDRFDDDRFDLDDRFDNDPFDDDRFDFDDDDFDDRLSRFGNGANFNFGRRARGSILFQGSLGKSLSKELNRPVNITPPSEIQLPPPPL